MVSSSDFFQGFPNNNCKDFISVQTTMDNTFDCPSCTMEECLFQADIFPLATTARQMYTSFFCLSKLVLFVVGEAGAASSAIAVAAAQAAMATLPMQPGRRGSGTLKAPYAAALGKILSFRVVTRRMGSGIRVLKTRSSRIKILVLFGIRDQHFWIKIWDQLRKKKYLVIFC